MKKIAGTYFRDAVAQNGITVQAPMDALNCGKVYCSGTAAPTEPTEPECYDFSEGGQVSGTLQYVGGVLVDSLGVFDATGHLVACFNPCGSGQVVMIRFDDAEPQPLADIDPITQFEGPPTSYVIRCQSDN